jgi:acetyl-CoA acetyltransferase
MDLGGIAIREALARAGVAGDQVDYVIMGHVIQAGAGQITASRSRSHQQHRPAGTLTQPGRTPERSL